MYFKILYKIPPDRFWSEYTTVTAYNKSVCLSLLSLIKIYECVSVLGLIIIKECIWHKPIIHVVYCIKSRNITEYVK